MVSINPLKHMKTMKKYMFIAVAGMLALSSCSNDDNTPTAQNAPRQMTFTAGFDEGGMTRATINDPNGTSTHSVSFDAEDRISIFSANNGNKVFTTAAGGSSASFTGTAVDGDPTYYAIYPYTYGVALSGTTITGVKIPDKQWNVGWLSGYDGWDPAAPVAWANTTGTNLQFHNLCAILKLYCLDGWSSYVSIVAKENMSGTFSLDTSTGTLSGGTYSFVNTSNKVGAYGTTLYLAIAPGTYTDFTINWNGNSKSKSSATFEAGKVYYMGVFRTNTWQQNQD